MSQPLLASIYIYPIKSTAPLTLSHAWVEEMGLAFDRRFVVIDQQQQFLSARTQPKLCLIQANLTAKGLVLNAPSMPKLVIEYHKLSNRYIDIQVWKDTIAAQQCSSVINQWFSQYLQRNCQLVFFGEQSMRTVKKRDSQVSFADGYPLLLISQASLTELNRRLASQNHQVSMTQFRPNIVVDNSSAYEEDSWQKIRIGEVEFEVTKPCVRCILTTVSPDTAEKHPLREPLPTLKQYRQLDSGEVLFGQNLVPLNEGQIKSGDKVEVISYKSAPKFIAPSDDLPTETELLSNKKQTNTLNFADFNKEIAGDNQQTILEQGEAVGLVLPHSCRAGLCGRCKAKLLDGQVQQFSQEGLSEQEQQQGYILTCSATPTSDITISYPVIANRKQRAQD